MRILYFILICILCLHFSYTNDCQWSTYRPGPYFGLRSTTEDSPLFGVMWYYPEKMDSVKTIRHFMEIGDNIKKYEWKAHNGCDFGNVNIEDTEMNLILDINFYNEITNGNHWVVNINGQQIKQDSKGIVIMWYITNPNRNKGYGINYDSTNKLVAGNYNTKDKSKTQFNVKWVQDKNNKHPVYQDTKYESEYYLILNISEDKLYDPSEYIIGELKDTVGNTPNHLTDDKDSYRSAGITKGNVFIQQLFFVEKFNLSIHFFDNKIIEKSLDFNVVDKMIKFKKQEFEEKFSKVFESKMSKKLLNAYDHKPTAISALSTLFSNLIYMNGNLQILDPKTNTFYLSKKLELLTIGPDKTSHSRGFMWDEGFQQRILSFWNLEMSLKVLTKWFNNVDEKSGWLAREQSLDNESRSRAPPSSWASIPDVSNPPSLFLFIYHLFDRQIDSSVLKVFLSGIIENMEKNASWYINSQQSSIDYVFSWKGKTDEFCLPSGLDDYPRSKLNGNKYIEGHVDLQSWMVALSKTMIKVYSFLDSSKYNDKITKWTTMKKKIYKNLIDYFWNEQTKKFDDFYIDNNNTKIFSNHTGYLQIFPLILNNFDDQLKENKYYIDNSLDLILNKEKNLRTDFGIRSLSNQDPFYKKGQNYWTSPIWININYLVIRSLNYLKSQPEYSNLSSEYDILRLAVVNNMIRNFNENGYIWEVYDDLNGNGKYNHPFTGWSALIVNLIYELY